MTRAEYFPHPRIVVEVTKPRLVGIYVNGEKRDIPAGVEIRTGDSDGRLWVDFTKDSMPELEGFAGVNNVEVKYVDEQSE